MCQQLQILHVPTYYHVWYISMKILWWNLSFLQCMYNNKKEKDIPSPSRLVSPSCNGHLVVVPGWRWVKQRDWPWAFNTPLHRAELSVAQRVGASSGTQSMHSDTPLRVKMLGKGAVPPGTTWAQSPDFLWELRANRITEPIPTCHWDTPPCLQFEKWDL